jgi:hypothetical protein
MMSGKLNLNEKLNSMITETTYSKFDLESGKCTCCADTTDEILIGDGRCIDCIEEEKFYEETMKGL